jgi:Fe-S cluster assembly iron-binding protein IscA
MVQITDVARDHIKEVLNQHPDKHVRIFVKGMG